MTFDFLSDSEDEEVPDWLKESGGEQTPADPEPSQESSSDAPTTPPEQPSESPGDQADQQLPDWMTESPTPEAAVEDETQDEDETPDWLSNIRESEADNQKDKQIAASAVEQAQDKDDSAWLDDIRSKEEANTKQAEQEDAIEGDFLDRVRDLQSNEEAEKPTAADVEESVADGLLSELNELEDSPEEAPDWVSGISPETAPSETPAEPPEGGFTNTGSLPSWLVQMKQTGELTEPAAQPSSSTLPDESSTASDGIEVPDLDLSLGELPDWISSPGEDDDLAEEFPSQAAPMATEDKQIEDARDMPDWVQGMRPSDVQAPDEKVLSGVEETMGPLSGLYNLIPAEPEIGQFVTPPAFSLNLDVTESQKANAALFEHIVKTNKPTGTAAMVARLLTMSVLRWSISILIILATLVPILTSSDASALPKFPPPREIIDLHAQIEALNPGDVVLLAFDFQPAAYAEMSAASSAVIDHLLLKGANLALMSTNPTGTATGELFLVQTQADNHVYISEREYQNLGFLSGGIYGLQNFATNPRNAMPQLIDIDNVKKSIWNTGPLVTVFSLSDFRLLIVLTDEIETARNWIEQVRPHLINTSLLLVTNAQTEPLIRPYYSAEPKQLDGFVAGLRAGAYYEQLIARTHVAGQYWNSYSAGLGMIASLVGIGSIIGWVANILTHRKSRPTKRKS